MYPLCPVSRPLYANRPWTAPPGDACSVGFAHARVATGNDVLANRFGQSRTGHSLLRRRFPHFIRLSSELPSCSGHSLICRQRIAAREPNYSRIPTPTRDVNRLRSYLKQRSGCWEIRRCNALAISLIDNNWGGNSMEQSAQCLVRSIVNGTPARNFAALCAIAATHVLWFTRYYGRCRFGNRRSAHRGNNGRLEPAINLDHRLKCLAD